MAEHPYVVGQFSQRDFGEPTPQDKNWRRKSAITEPKKVLFVDDDPDTIDTYSDQFNSREIAHETAANAEEAIAKLAVGRFAVAIIDGLGGDCVEVFKAAEEAETVPILFSGSYELVKVFQEDGQRAVSKSTRIEGLLEAIKDLI